ncbi:MAG TPA: hypothetical protein VK950_01590 [Methylophilus sp.]|nr:hypothetical protein [Methylophilus sp.]
MPANGLPAFSQVSCCSSNKNRACCCQASSAMLMHALNGLLKEYFNWLVIFFKYQTHTYLFGLAGNDQIRVGMPFANALMFMQFLNWARLKG